MAKKINRKPERSIDALATSFRTTHGGFTTQEVEEVVKGIYIPDFSERWVRDSNVYLLGMLEMHVGKYGTGKSTQLMRMLRTFIDAGGLAFYIETEGKETPAFIKATMGDRAYSPRFTVIHAKTLGDAGKDKKKKERRTKAEEELDDETAKELGWFTHVYNVIKWCKTNCPDAPVLIAIDTITSAPTEEHLREFDANEGQMRAASTKQLRRAKVIKDWLEAVCAEIRSTNILVACTNHVTDEVNLDGGPSYGAPETKWAGGSVLGQRAATIIEYHKGHAREDSVETSTSAVRITVRKNSNGTGARRLQVAFDYRHLLDDSGKPILQPNGEKIRVVNWQWGQATVNLLSSFFNPEHRPEWERQGPEEYRRIVRMETKGQNPHKRYSMRAYDENERDQELWEVRDLSVQEMANFIESSAEAQLTLQNILLTGVASHTVYSYLEDDAPTAQEIAEHGSDETDN